jgi:hypothetical protein
MRGIIALFLLLFSLSAQGQFVIDSYRFGAAAADLLLDSFPGAAAAYSLRKLDKDYSGNAIMVRRSSDGDSLNIGFSVNYLDTIALKTFCGTGGSDSCFIRTWYDQSGNNRQARQTTNFSQPIVMINGSILYDSLHPTAFFDGASFDWLSLDTISSNAVWSVFEVKRRTDEALRGPTYTNFNTTGGIAVAYSLYPELSSNMFLANTNTLKGPLTYSSVNREIFTSINADNTAGNLNGYINGTLLSLSSAASTRSTLPFNSINRRGSNSAWGTGNLQEIIIYQSNQSTNRTAIETNINNFYSIY